MPDYIKSPRQATTVFGLDGQSVPRKKSLFYIRFRRADNAQASKSSWQDNLGFMAKSIDRPSVTPQIDELNQYGKKRQVTTGYKHQPLRLVLYDTADSMALRMWYEYSRWYFGDYRQDDDSIWDYDITTESMLDNGQGFGFTLRENLDETTDLNSQFFFDALEVYQVWGGYFTQFDLINPKISAFDPDELDFSVTEPSTISVTLAYEALIHQNGAVPQPIIQNARLAQIFNTQGLFNGQTFDPTDGPNGRPRLGYAAEPTALPVQPTNSLTSFTNRTIGQVIDSSLHTNSGNSTGGGSLGIFGNYNFGSVTRAVGVNTGSLVGDVSYLATGNPALASLLNLQSGASASSVASQVLSTGRAFSGPSALSSDKLAAAGNALLGQAANQVANKYATQYVNKNLLGGVAATSLLNGGSAADQLNTGGTGLSIKTDAVAVINANRSAESQLGFNSIQPLVPVVVDGNPSGFLPAGVPDVNIGGN